MPAAGLARRPRLVRGRRTHSHWLGWREWRLIFVGTLPPTPRTPGAGSESRTNTVVVHGLKWTWGSLGRPRPTSDPAHTGLACPVRLGGRKASPASTGATWRLSAGCACASSMSSSFWWPQLDGLAAQESNHAACRGAPLQRLCGYPGHRLSQATLIMKSFSRPANLSQTAGRHARPHK